MNYTHITPLNLVGIPTSYIASSAFNNAPLPMRISGVREMNAPLFEIMEKHDIDLVPELFLEHMRAMFELDWVDDFPAKKYRACYLRLLRGWFFDSGRPEAAVMKGWVESRFGLKPSYHREIIENINSSVYIQYLMERMSPRFHNNGIDSQLDLFYEYVQYFLERFGPRTGKFKLYRGINGLDRELQVVEKLGNKDIVVRNNCLNSYSSSMERASEFGDNILEVQIPFAKIFCLPAVLPQKLPSYENEFIVLGGDYISKIVSYY